MHVTILQLTDSPKPGLYHFTADDVAGMHDDKFPDGVTEHTGETRQDDINTLLDMLGEAVTGKGVESADGRSTEWIDVDTHAAKLQPVFRTAFEEAQKAISQLSVMTLADFATGDNRIAGAMYRLKAAYGFDNVYIMDAGGDCTAVSEWLRDLAYVEGGHVVRYYIHATYDGDQ